MKNRLGEYIREERKRQGLSYGDVARRIGYRNAGKGGRRIAEFEREGIAPDDLPAKIVEALGLDPARSRELAEVDHAEWLAEWNQWLDEPVPVKLIVRYLACVYISERVPHRPDWTREEWEAYAGDVARKKKLMACLALSRRQRSWIDQEGQVYKRGDVGPEDRGLPCARLRGRNGSFTFEAGA